MSDQTPPAAPADVHVSDWTIVHLTGDVTADSAEALAAHVTPMLTPGAHVAIDVRRGSIQPGPGVAKLVALLEAAEAGGARVVVIQPHADERESLLADGVFDVHESLDAALGVHDPAVTHARDRRNGPALAPAVTDALLVTAEDMTGQDTGHLR
jgi:hypothetical protein